MPRKVPGSNGTTRNKPGRYLAHRSSLAQKVRPALILSVAFLDHERALVAYVPRTTVLRSTRFEVIHPAKGFEPGAFDAQGIVTVPTVRLMNHLGTLTADQPGSVERGVCAWLGIKIAV